MSTFFEMECGGETVTIEKTDDGDFIFHGWDEETELAAIELGFEPSACGEIWTAINDDMLVEELSTQSTYGDANAIKALLFLGVSVNCKEHHGWRPLHYAAGYGNIDAVKVLLEAGAGVDTRTDFFSTPLHLAAMDGHDDAVRILLEAGASVNAKDAAGGTPLHIAEINKNKSVVKIISDWIAEHGS